MLSIYFSIFILLLVLAAFAGVSYVCVCGLPHGEIFAAGEAAVSLPKKARYKKAAKKPQAENPAEKVTAPTPEEDARLEETVIFSKEEIEEATKEISAPAPSRFPLEPAPEILSGEETPEAIGEYFVRHFLNRYSAVSRQTEEDTRLVTERLIGRISEAAGGEAADILTHIMVQESVQNAQRTYALLPQKSVLGMVEAAVLDVALGQKSDTKTILAYDALKAMPRLELPHFRALSLLLLFHYSRNTENYTAEALRAYAEKYVTPLLEQLPEGYSGYQQLEYLHCVSLNNKDTAFGEVLRDSYPIVFSFRGCMKNELDGLRAEWPEGALVPSLYNSYFKAAVVDETMLTDYFETYGFTEEKERTALDVLLHSRPVAYDRREMAHLLGKISPSLAKLQEAWDSSLLRRASLTLMGMYIAKLYMKETVGEDFDLSHWM